MKTMTFICVFVKNLRFYVFISLIVIRKKLFLLFLILIETLSVSINVRYILYLWCGSHYSNVQNKQQEQHLPVQQPQLGDKK